MSHPPSVSKPQAAAGLAVFALSLLLANMAPALSSAPLAFAQSCTPVSAANLVGHWKFDENTGTTTADSTGNGHTGTLQNGPLWSSGTTVITPNPSALALDGSNDHVSVANSSDLEFGTGSFTVSLFAKTGTGNTGVLGNFNGSSRGWGLYFYSGNHVNFFGYGNLGINDAAKPGTVLNNQWHHVAGVFTHSGNTLKIDTYVDGTFVGTNTATVGDISSTSPLHFGHYVGQPYFEGSLDDIRIYGRTLNGTEISSLAAGCGNAGSSSSASSVSSSSLSSTSSSSVSSSTGSSLSSSVSSTCSPVALTGLAGYWKFDEGTGTIANDSTTFNNTGTLLNGAGYSTTVAPVNFSNPRSLTLDGSNDYVRVHNTFNFPAASTARTVAIWMRQTQLTNQATLMALGNGSNSTQKFIVMMGTAGPNTYAFTDGVNNANNITLTGSHIPSLNAWHHVAFTFNGTNGWQYFLDGVLQKSGTFPVAINTNVNQLEIGARHDTLATGHFFGLLDDARLYNRVLTNTELANLAGGCGNTGSSSSSSSILSSLSSSSATSVSSSLSSSTSSTSSSSSSTGNNVVPTCDGHTATIYVRNNKIVGGTSSGSTYGGFLAGTNNADVIVGTAATDFIRGLNGNDVICGRAGNDFISGDNGDDEIHAGEGDDVVFGAAGVDTLWGNDGIDRLFGGNDQDVLCGQATRDYLQGQSGNDRLDGGAAFDYLSGGTGTNVCANGESSFGCTSTVASLPQCANNNQ